MKLFIVVFVFTLLCPCLADYAVNFTCNDTGCGDNSSCMSLDGISFGANLEYAYPYPCSSWAPTLFINYVFECNSNCTKGCLIVVENGTTESVCSEEPAGQLIVADLDAKYNITQGNESLSLAKDWCNCTVESSGLSTEATIGIVIGSVVALALVIGLVVYCFMKKGKSEEGNIPVVGT